LFTCIASAYQAPTIVPVNAIVQPVKFARLITAAVVQIEAHSLTPNELFKEKNILKQL
jgi:hypothetical protein